LLTAGHSIVSSVNHWGFSTFYQTQFVDEKHSYSYLSVPELYGLSFIILLNSMSLITTGRFLPYTVAGAVIHRWKAVNCESEIKECK